MIVHFEDTLGEIGRTFRNPPDTCFLCGGPLVSYPLVLWHGTGDKQIWLHGRCATELGGKLFAEGLEADMQRNVSERMNGR